MFRIIFISLCSVMHLYLSWRIVTLSKQWPESKRRIWLVSGAIWVIFSSCLMLHLKNVSDNALCEWLWSQWVGILFVMLWPLLIVDLLTLGGRLSARWHQRGLRYALALGVFLCILATVQGLRAPNVTRYTVTLESLPSQLDGITIVAVSDLHLGTLINSAWLGQRVQQIEELSPDMVVLVGDIFDISGPQAQPFTEQLRTIKAPLGVWAVSGNHESYSKGRMELFAAADMTLLHNRWSMAAPGLIVAGVEDLTTAQRQNHGKGLIEEALSSRPQQTTILLSHSPLQLEQAADNNVDLMISGHTHNGQIWPFNYLVALRYPCIHGLYHIGHTQLIVGAGTGTWGPRMRLWQTAEIVQIVLRAKKN